MRRTSQITVVLLAAAIDSCFLGSAALAADVLADGGLELSAGPANWTLTQSITGMPGAPVSAVEHLDQGNEPVITPGELGLRFKSTTGNNGVYAGLELAVNANISQTVAVGANRPFTFTGHSNFQVNASAIVNTLGELTPLGDYNLNKVVDAADYTIWRDTLGSTEDFRANGTNEGASLDLIDQADYEYWKARYGKAGHPAGTPSPTQAFFTVEFLDANDAVLATHNIDMRSDPTTEAWRTSTLSGLTSPAGTTKARVTAGATNMVANCSVCEGGGQDFFYDNFSLLDTGLFGGEKLMNGNLNTLGAPDGWVIEKTPEDNLSFAGAASFAAHTGNVGAWLRSFNGGDAKILQTVAATAGANYEFSSWVKWQGGFAGFDPLSSTQSFLTMEFLDAANSVIGTQSLDLRTVVPFPSDSQGEWNQFSVGGLAPANTSSVRVSAGATGMMNSGINPQSAFFDDFALAETLPGAGGLATVPEPSCVVLIGIAIGMLGVGRRRSGGS
jgi:hypothetical protein